MKYLTVKNWSHLQHYKDRKPTWIKLHTDTFQDYEFACLQDASKLLAICIWTIAARSSVGEQGQVPADLAFIKSQCGLGSSIKEEHLQELIRTGFVIDASESLATCLQPASLEGEGEREGEKEVEGRSRSSAPPKPPPETTIQDEVRQAWNALAQSKPGWSQCTKRPGGDTGKMLQARCRDPGWLQDYPAALERLRGIKWFKRGKLSTFVRPDTVRKILDGEWDDHNDKTDIAQKHEDYDGAF